MSHSFPEFDVMVPDTDVELLICKIELLQRQLAQANAVIEQQKEVIERLHSTPADKREDLRCVISDLCDQAKERDTLIETLAEAISRGVVQVRQRGTTGDITPRTFELWIEALAAYENWRAK